MNPLTKTKTHTLLLAGCFTVVIAVQFAIALVLQYEPKHDVGVIFNGAINLSMGRPLGYDVYFAMFANNWGLLRFMAVVFRLVSLGGLVDINYFMVYATVMILSLNTGLYFMFDLLRKRLGVKFAFVGLFMVMAYVPVFLFPCMIYTDVATIFVPMTALNLFYRIKDSQDKKKKLVYAVGIGVVLGIGFIFKPTTVIIFISMLLLGGIVAGKNIYKYLALSLAIVLAVSFVNDFDYKQSISPELIERYKVPKSQWILAGLRLYDQQNGEHRYKAVDVGHYYSITTQIESLQERKQYANFELKNRMNELGVSGLAQTLFEKLLILYQRVDFAPGGVIDFAATPATKAIGNIRWTPLYGIYNGIIFYSMMALAWLSVLSKKGM